jgi:hypothetical protein
MAGAAWLAAASVAQAALGPEIGRAVQQMEERIEQQLKGKRAAPPRDPQPTERSHEEAIEPWELVSV